MISRYFVAFFMVPLFSQLAFAACENCFVYRNLEVDHVELCDLPVEDLDITLVLNPACVGPMTAPGGPADVCAAVDGQIVSDGKRFLCKFAKGKEWPPKPFPTFPDSKVNVSKKLEARLKIVDLKRVKAAKQ